MRLSVAFTTYSREYIQFKGQSESTDRHNSDTAGSLIRFLGDIEIEDLTLNDVRRWKANMTRGYTVSTTRGYIIKLRVVLDYFSYMDILSTAVIPVPKRINKAPDSLTLDEVELLMDSAPSLISRTIISFLFTSGLRVSELCSLNRTDFKSHFPVTGKGGDSRLIFIAEQTQILVKKYLDGRTDSRPELFINKEGNRLNPGNTQLFIRNAKRLSGIEKKITPHILRHSYAIFLLEQKVDIRTIQVLMGHKDISTTMLYLKVSDKHLEEQYLSAFNTLSKPELSLSA